MCSLMDLRTKAFSFPLLFSFKISDHQGALRSAFVITLYILSFLDTVEYRENDKIMFYRENLRWKNLLFTGSP